MGFVLLALTGPLLSLSIRWSLCGLLGEENPLEVMLSLGHEKGHYCEAGEERSRVHKRGWRLIR
jgi:hypothetical protein